MAEVEFADGLPHMADVIEWAKEQDVSGLRKFLVEDEPERPLITISSGGASAPLCYAAQLYSSYKGIGFPVTPLSFASLSDETVRNSKILILSNSGHGVDPNYTSQRCFSLNPEHTAVITKPGENNDLMPRALKHGIPCFAYDWPDYGVKGFVSTLSHVATFALIYMAFTGDNEMKNLPLSIAPEDCFTYQTRVAGGETKSFGSYSHYVILHAGYGEAVARDMETKFIECGMASVQVCDYRNFCHGRFIFVSNNFDDTCLVLIRTPREKQFSEDLILKGLAIHKDKKTGEYPPLFPEDMPVVLIDTELTTPLAGIDLMMKSQVFFTEAAKGYGYDPLKPVNRKNIDKKKPRGLSFKGIKDIALNNNFNK